MSFSGRMDRAFQNALRLPLSCRTRYILLSDCHRGTGNANDNFQKNEFLYLAALDYYFRVLFFAALVGSGIPRDSRGRQMYLTRNRETRQKVLFKRSAWCPWVR